MATIDESIQALDAATQRTILSAAESWAMERYGTEPDQVRLLNNDTAAPQGSVYEIEVSAGGALDQLHLYVQPDGQVEVRMVA